MRFFNDSLSVVRAKKLNYCLTGFIPSGGTTLEYILQIEFMH